MATAPTANDIKAQLKTLLTPLIATALTRKAKILDNLGVAFDAAAREDPTQLRSPLDDATTTAGQKIKRVNCLIISEDGFAQGPQPRDATRMSRQARPSRVVERRFRLTYFYQYGDGSENAFSATVEIIREAIESSAHLGFAMTDSNGHAGQGAYIEGHDELQMPVMLPDAFGDVICHVAEGTLTVRVTKTTAG